MSESLFSLPKSTHLCTSKEFARVYDGKCKASTEHLLVFAQSNGSDSSRIGLSVSKKNGSAVKRNLIKRRLREAFRHERRDLPVGFDFILIPKKSIESSLVNYREALRSLCPMLAKRCQRQMSAAAPVEKREPSDNK